MAAPKKCKSLMKRRISSGNRIKSKKAKAFNGVSINTCNVLRCNGCQTIMLSHKHCESCVMKKANLVKIKVKSGKAQSK